MKSTSTLFSSLSPKPSIEHRDISTRWRQPCQSSRSSCTSTSCFGRWRTSTPWEFVTEISNPRICYSILPVVFSSCATLEVQRSWLNPSQMFRTFALDTTVLQSWYLVPPTTPPKLVCTPHPQTVDVLTMICRRVVYGVRHGWINAWSTALPRWVGYWPACWDHQSTGHSNKGSDTNHEPELHGAQVPPNQATSIQQSIPQSLARGYWAHISASGVHANSETVGHRSHVPTILWRASRSFDTSSRLETCWRCFTRAPAALQLHSPR